MLGQSVQRAGQVTDFLMALLVWNERRGLRMDWNERAAPWLKWEAEIEVVLGSFLEGLLERADLLPGEAVLDVGCGSGGSTLRAVAAVGAAGRVQAVDIAPPLAERARARVDGAAEVVIGDAQTHGFEAGGFDAVISKFGVMFFEDTEAAFVNLRQAVRPGGRMHFVAWGAPVRNDWFAMPRRVAIERLGPGEPPDPLAPGPFAFADAARVKGLMEAAGWQVAVETVASEIVVDFPAATLAALQLDMGAASLVLAERDSTEADRTAIEAGIKAEFDRMTQQGRVHVPAEVHYFAAVSPG